MTFEPEKSVEAIRPLIVGAEAADPDAAHITNSEVTRRTRRVRTVKGDAIALPASAR